MKAIHRPRIVDLSPNVPLVLDHAVGTRITVCTGTVWLTQYGDARDHVIKAGHGFDIEVPACVIVSGLEEARVRVEPAPPKDDVRRRAAWRWPLRWDRSERAVLGTSAVRRLRLG